MRASCPGVRWWQCGRKCDIENWKDQVAPAGNPKVAQGASHSERLMGLCEPSEAKPLASSTSSAHLLSCDSDTNLFNFVLENDNFLSIYYVSRYVSVSSFSRLLPDLAGFLHGSEKSIAHALCTGQFLLQEYRAPTLSNHTLHAKPSRFSWTDLTSKSDQLPRVPQRLY